MHSEKFQAFVLATRAYGESDRIVTLFTLEQGKTTAFARAARKSRKRFGAALETFARIEAQVRVKQGLAGLDRAEIRSIYPRIRCDLARIAHALYACELVESMIPEGQPLPRLFRLLAAYLDRLEVSEVSESERRFFEINLLNILGYRPALDSCSRCGIPFDEEVARLQDSGEVTCRGCAGGMPLLPTTLVALRNCLGTGTFGLIQFTPETLAQAAALLDASLAVHAGRRLKSLDFLRQIQLPENTP